MERQIRNFKSRWSNKNKKKGKQTHIQSPLLPNVKSSSKTETALISHTFKMSLTEDVTLTLKNTEILNHFIKLLMEVSVNSHKMNLLLPQIQLT